MAVGEKILIVDDHPVVVDGLVLILEQLMPSCTIVTAGSGSSACELVDNHRNADWIFLDVNLPDADGIELLKRFDDMKLTAQTIILSRDCSPQVVDRAIRHRANGFLSKSFDRSELTRCIQVVEAGDIYLAPALQIELKHYQNSVLEDRRRIESALTPRSLQTLSLMEAGYSNKEIASSCNIAESTVKSRVKVLMTLFDADNRTHCVFEAKRLNII